LVRRVIEKIRGLQTKGVSFLSQDAVGGLEKHQRKCERGRFCRK